MDHFVAAAHSGGLFTAQPFFMRHGIHVPLKAAINAAFFGVMHYFHFFNYTFNATDFCWALVAGLMINIIATGFYEGLFLFEAGSGAG